MKDQTFALSTREKSVLVDQIETLLVGVDSRLASEALSDVSRQYNAWHRHLSRPQPSTKKTHERTSVDCDAPDRHPTTNLITCCGSPAAIDDDMVPLVTALWNRGVHTCNGSCQGAPGGTAWIMFPDLGEADKFRRLVRSAGARIDLDPGSDAAWSLSLGSVGGHLRFPLTTRCYITLRLPNDQIDQAAEWIEAAPAGALDGMPEWPEVVAVSDLAGIQLTEDDMREYEAMVAEMEERELELDELWEREQLEDA